jgi:hypothetical protein
MGEACSTCGERGGVFTVLFVKSEYRDQLGDIGLDKMIILIWIFGKCDAVLWTGTTWFRIGTEGRDMLMR